MANNNRLERGQYYMLSVGDGGSPETFTPIACLTKKELNTDVTIIDGTSDCGPDFEPGFSKTNFGCAGFVDYAFLTNGNVSGPTIFQLQQDAAKRNFVIEPVDSPAAGDQKDEMYGFFANYKQSWDTDTMIGMDFTIQVKGNVTQTIWNGSSWVTLGE